MNDVGVQSKELTELSEALCTSLLARHTFGRLAYIEPGDRVAVRPINYKFEGDGVSIRTGLGSKLNFAPLSWLALEIDGASDNGSWGWSVVARGYAFDITTALDERSFNLREMAIQPMAPGDRDHYLSIHVHEVTGRSFGRAPVLVDVEQT